MGPGAICPSEKTGPLRPKKRQAKRAFYNLIEVIGSCFPSSTNARSARVHVLEFKSRAEHRHREQEADFVAGTTRLQAHKTFFSDNGAGIASTTGQSPGRQRPRLLRVPGHDRNKINVPKGGSTNEKPDQEDTALPGDISVNISRESCDGYENQSRQYKLLDSRCS